MSNGHLAVLALVAILTGAVLARIFLFQIRWSLLEFLALTSLASIPIGLAFRAAAKEIQGVGDFIACFFMGIIWAIPVFIGAWWANHTATRLDETRPARRVLLMLVGSVCLIPAFLTVPYSFLFLLRFAIRPSREDFQSLVGAGAGWLVFVLPIILIERRCRSYRREKYPARATTPRAGARKR